MATKFGRAPHTWLAGELDPVGDAISCYLFDMQVLRVGLEEEQRQHRAAQRRSRRGGGGVVVRRHGNR